MKFDLNIENINYAKIIYKDNEGFAHCIKTAIRLMSEAEVLACIKYDYDLNIKTPQEVELNIASDNGLYKSKTILRRIEKDDHYLLFSLQKPEEMEYRQNREFFRVRLEENVTIIYEKDDSELTESSIIYDISANGVRIELDEVIDFPPEVNLILHLPQREVKLSAKYIRTDEEDGIYKASFRYSDINQADSDYISQICFKKQLEEKRKNFA